jgi:hypothetical protein
MIAVSKTAPQSLNHTCFVATWADIPLGEVGEPIELANFADRSVQVTGEFGAGGSVRIEGSINGTDYAPLTDPQGNTLDINTAKIEAVSEVVRYIRPRVTAGDGTMLLKGTV